MIACLADTDSYWKALVSKEFTVCMQMALTAISTIAGIAYKEMEGENDLRTKHDVQNIDLIYGTLHLFGANSTSMIPGTKCTYSTSTAFGETGYIILSCIGNCIAILSTINLILMLSQMNRNQKLQAQIEHMEIVILFIHYLRRRYYQCHMLKHHR